MSWLDLHMHSSYSVDGQYTPAELMEICEKSGIKVAAICDHNVTFGVAEGLTEAQKRGIELIPGIEIDCNLDGTDIHLLGYFIDPDYPGFLEIGMHVLRQEQQAAQKRLELVLATGLIFDAQALLEKSQNGVVIPETIAKEVLENGKNDKNPLLDPYRPGGARSGNPYVNFFWDFCSQGKPCFVPMHHIPLQEAVEHVRTAGGVPIFAHPGPNIRENPNLLKSAAEKGVLGLEAFSSYHTPEQKVFYRDYAQKTSLAMTCGSDFHGATKPSILAGSVDCGGVENELLAALRALKL